ncbi:hypothetical protein PGC35_07390 [Psychrobacillus sp. PGGUH221]|uniref:hypothetical protein n=1 Tax=Psychrobacillus sp. PGGUH221 TaxID=3020058 RepID=UPI0035C72875
MTASGLTVIVGFSTLIFVNFPILSDIRYYHRDRYGIIINLCINDLTCTDCVIPKT